MFAKVIVDIPVAQVNREFDYAIPEEWEEIITLGMRIQVPFGSRQLLGFVVGFSQETEFAGAAKPITQLLDYQSYLNEELIELSHYLAEHLQSFRIVVLQAMLPNLLKVKYETVFTVLEDSLLSPEAKAVFGENREVSREILDAALSVKQIRTLIDSGAIQLVYRVQDKKSTKKEYYYQLTHSSQQYLELLETTRKSATKQRELLQFLSEQTEQGELSAAQIQAATTVTAAVMRTAVDNQWLKKMEREVYRNPLANRHFEPTEQRILRPVQQAAYDAVAPMIQQRTATTFLLEGVTGSGKTEVYLQLMAAARQQGKSALLLVPEIALTPQMVERVMGRFQTGVAVLHSGLSTSEKYDEWQRIIKGEATIVVGARSSVFAPLKNLGILIIDEEHETTYKQSDNPRYHARDVAIWRSQYHGCPVVLGSATPSLESRARAQVGRYQLIKMSERANFSNLPSVTLIDMTKVLGQETMTEISPLLLDKMKMAIEQQHQVVLLLNRRGYASYLQCRECGHVIQCPRCDISLTYHKHEHSMKCHYCDYQQSVPYQCPACQSQHLRLQGSGTQKIEEVLQTLLPQARILRMDNDTTRRKGDHERILQQFGQRKADILLGTQMIAKGLDFENVTVVGVINADTALNIPDFRAGEKTFQLLTQVAGRTGRGALAGEVFIQTYNPEHYVMQLVTQHDYERFFQYEMKRRHIGNYPPYYFTTLITVSSKNAGKAERKIHEIKQQLSQPVLEQTKELLILGPTRGGIARINEVYYYQLLLKYKDKQLIQSAINQLVQSSQAEVQQGLYVTVDHEPYHFI
ncbi:primosomal protein N' [Aerococcaceae bacterium zg-ZUI334]|uniref:primosomal protein N' n=1 Tax=Aerococcaceae bacterium zg-252 TaxID=2796928 RepID=UPI001B947A9F|nr:primosomal protein N' [Aerococcaceae bacterium zg-ZUI334]